MPRLKHGAFGRSRRGTAALVLGALLLARAATGEEWHEAYRAGIQALARGDHPRAVQRLRRAATLRAEPGRNVVTYGTNVEPRYFPYLRLAEAYLALGQLQDARDALEVSATWKREPADERRQLEARLESALDSRRPSPAATPAPAPPLTPPSTLSGNAAAPATTSPSSPAFSPSPPATTVIPPSALPRSAPTPPARPAVSPPPQPAALPVSGTVEIVSQPAGAAAYLDDELLGATDPETGRLVKTGLRAGLHRVRVALAGHEEMVREIEVPTRGSVAIYAALKPLTPAASDAAGRNAPGRADAGGITSGGGVIAFAAVALALVAVVAWTMLRRPASPAPPLWASTPRPPSGAGVSVAATPAGHFNPGARQDTLGQEWFGDFRLVEMLGRGGMASVYKAERSAELLALKRPLASLLDDSDFLERFLREAEIGRALNHPNIVRILGRGRVDGVPYFTMELLPGQTLQAFLTSWGGAEPRTAASIVVQVAEALDFAHSKGVIHRDLKPSNIMLLLDGTAKVMDFGIARAKRFEGLTTTGAFLGTPEYVAPEIIEGQGAEPRSDLYSLGVVFYELLTGQRPFMADTVYALLQKHCTEEPPSPSQFRKGIPAELEILVQRLLAKTPEGRPASAEELVVSLRDWLNRAV